MVPISNFLTNLRGKNDWSNFAQGSGKCDDYHPTGNCVTVCEINLDKLEMQGRITSQFSFSHLMMPIGLYLSIQAQGHVGNEELKNEIYLNSTELKSGLA